MTPQDIIDYELEDAIHPLEAVDIKRAKDALKNDPFIKHHKEWQQTLEKMQKWVYASHSKPLPNTA